jgi:hypothetical protein
MLTQVLSALVQGAGGQAGQRAWTALAALTGRALGYDSAETQAIETSRTASPDPARVSNLAEGLARLARTDPAFTAELTDWLTGAQALLTGDQTLNQVTGQVTGPVIQARDVSGGITIGPTPTDPTA